MGDAQLTREAITTTPYNPYFPNQNQTKHCWVSFVDFKKCEKKLGKGADDCKKYFVAYHSLCPEQWVEKWNSQIEAGTFAGQALIDGGAKHGGAKH